MLPPYWFIGVSLAASVFYSARAFAIFHVSGKDEDWSWWVHQVWFNFLGAIVGWAALWLLISKLRSTAATESVQIDGWDFGLFVVAFIGVTGHLPRTLVGLVVAPGELFSRLVGR